MDSAIPLVSVGHEIEEGSLEDESPIGATQSSVSFDVPIPLEELERRRQEKARMIMEQQEKQKQMTTNSDSSESLKTDYKPVDSAATTQLEHRKQEEELRREQER